MAINYIFILVTLINLFWTIRACESKQIFGYDRLPYIIASIIPLFAPFVIIYLITKRNPKIDELEKRISDLENRDRDVIDV